MSNSIEEIINKINPAFATDEKQHIAKALTKLDIEPDEVLAFSMEDWLFPSVDAVFSLKRNNRRRVRGYA